MPTAEYAIVETAMSSRWTRFLGRLVLLVAVLGGLWLAFKAFVVIRTDQLWFRTVDASQVHNTLLGAQILLFVVFGGITTLVVAASLTAVARSRPVDVPARESHPWRYLFSQIEPRIRRWGFLVISVWLGIRAGRTAASQWQTYLLWRHATPWGSKDAQFHRDISYFVEVLPFHQMVVSAALSTLWTAMVVTVLASYVYGTIYVRRQRPWVTRPFMAQMSLLIGLWLLAQAPNYWLSRFEASLSNGGPVTGLSYTDIHARVPGFIVLMVVAVIAAIILFVNVKVARLRYAVVGLGLMLVASLLIGSAWPTLVSKFREQPSATTLDRLTVERNQAATEKAYSIGDVTTQSSPGLAQLSGTALSDQASANTQVRVLDPNQLSPTFNFKQQIQAYYQFKSTLDLDHYPLTGTDGATAQQDVAIAARELNLGGIPRSSWTNRHLVYTHGYGVVAAPTDQLDPKTGTPTFINGGLPPKNQIPVEQPRIYFGQNEPNYSIVGQPPGSTRNLEFDFPGTTGTTDARTTYTGDGGVPIGSRLDRLLFAYQLSDPNIFFSSDINSSSQLLTIRDPRQRVAKVAPWLTLDGDVYPTLVGGHVEWVVDGYTSSSNYPASQQVNLRAATSSSLTASGSSVLQPNTSVNYLQNSVKAVVDAYTGKVTLYSWNQDQQPDPLLKAWESVYPGLVKPQSDIPSDLLEHLRYPQDLFDVQRMLLAKYHVKDPGDFYNGSGFWKVPNDPTVAATSSLNSGAAASGGASPTLASTYMSMSPTGSGAAQYLLSSPLVTLNYRDLAGFLSVDATPGADYGKFTLLTYPAGGSTEAPAQIQNDIESDNAIAKELTLERGGNSQVLLGNLLAIPLGSKMLYVEPVYTQATGGNSFPILRHVVAVYGDGQPAFEDTLDAALTQAFANDAESSG